jgi:hypothetical protein
MRRGPLETQLREPDRAAAPAWQVERARVCTLFRPSLTSQSSRRLPARCARLQPRLISNVRSLVSPARLIPILGLWLVGVALAVALPAMLVVLAERACPPPQIEPNSCSPWARTWLLWLLLGADAGAGAAAAVIFPSLAAPVSQRARVSIGCLAAGIATIALVLAVFPFLPVLAIPALSAGVAGALSVRVVWSDVAAT